MFDVNEYLEENEESIGEAMQDFDGLDEYLLDPIEAEAYEAMEGGGISATYLFEDHDFDNVA